MMTEERPLASSSLLSMVTTKPEAEAEAEAEALHPLPSHNSFLGKHRISAAIARLDQEIQFLQEELHELDAMDASSRACKEVVSSIESMPDGLLPLTKGPANVAWDRWFQGTHGSHSHKWWTHKRYDIS